MITLVFEDRYADPLGIIGEIRQAGFDGLIEARQAPLSIGHLVIHSDHAVRVIFGPRGLPFQKVAEDDPHALRRQKAFGQLIHDECIEPVHRDGPALACRFAALRARRAGVIAISARIGVAAVRGDRRQGEVPDIEDSQGGAAGVPLGHVNGKRSWYALADALYDEFLELPDGDEDDADPRKALAEALGRFAAGTQTPTPERLEALSRYLVERKVLSGTDLKPSQTFASLFPPSPLPGVRVTDGSRPSRLKFP